MPYMIVVLNSSNLDVIVMSNLQSQDYLFTKKNSYEYPHKT
jgi:hypothetical protein